MAAVLKKRAIAEFTQVIQEEAKPPEPKKLRLVHRPVAAEISLEIQKAASSQEVLQKLLLLEDALPLPQSQIAPLVHNLVEQLYKEHEPHVKAKLASIVAELIKTPPCNSSWLVKDVKDLLKSEKSHKVKAQLIGLLQTIGLCIQSDSKLLLQILKIARDNLKDTNHLVRGRCLELIGKLGHPTDVTTEAEEAGTSTQVSTSSDTKVLLKLTQDDDPRVRTGAFQAMILWHERGIRLEETIYVKVCQALEDDYQGVRLATLKLVWIFCHMYPESIVTVEGSEEKIRLVDDGFAKICHMVNDLCMPVRAEATSLLGSLHQVSPKFLEQTLDKKLMSNMRRKEGAHERQKEHFEKGEWATGKKWADDAPKEEMEAEEVTLMSSGACGAFVHGLEDEFLEVRNAAIDSVCELAGQSERFAQLCQDFLIDMFNDEIDSVRLNAISSLRKIAKHLLIREDQLEIILGVLKDFSVEIRETAHELIRSSSLATKTCLNSCVMTLLDNLKRYPEDRSSIWSCMKELGCNHHSLTLPLVPELLSSHPYFDSFEPEMDDPAYISILILVFNAAENNPTMSSLLLDHTKRHHMYLRDTMPNLVPDLQLAGGSSTENVQRSHEATQAFLKQTFQRLSSVEKLNEKQVIQMIKMALRDLQRLADIDPALKASSDFIILFLDCQLILTKLLSRNQYVASSPSNVLDASSNAVLDASSNAVLDASSNAVMIKKVIDMSHQMEQLFLGLSLQELVQIRQIRLCAQTLQLLSKLQTHPGENKSACVHYLQTLNQLQRFIKSRGVEPDSFTSAALSELHQLESCDPVVYLPVLQRIVSHHTPVIPKLNNNLLHSNAIITHPTPDSDNTIKFTAGLATAVHIRVELENIEKLDSLRLQVKYPDKQYKWFIPKSSDFRQLSALKHRLNTNVLLSHDIWSDVADVELSVVVCHNLNQDVTGAKTQPLRLEANKDNVLELGKPIKLHILPTPVKK